jgi:Ca2+-binding EF-hand superfamily protein
VRGIGPWFLQSVMTVRQEQETQLTPAQLDQIKEVFDVIDRNGDGSLTIDELKLVLKELGKEVTDEEIEALM